MRRNWNWGGRASKRDGGGADREVSTSSSSSSGCMAAVLHFFDFQQIQFQEQQTRPSSKPSSNDNVSTVTKGLEAPRNSLESEEDVPAGSTTTNVEEDNLKFPSGIQIKTKLTKSKSGILNDEPNCVSPGTKTPTLVARLMGLDLLPDAQSPSSSLSMKSQPLRPRQHVSTKPRKSTDSDVTSCRSLPETPRISLTRRSDVDHRLSLQINKENHSGSEEFEVSRISLSRKKVEEQTNKSPRHYARQIVKQVKESVGRKVGLDVTNTVKTRDHRRDELLLSNGKSKKASYVLETIQMNALLDECSPGKQSASCSPRLKFIDTKNKIRASSSSSAKQSTGFSQLQSVRVVGMPNAPGLHEQKKSATASEKFILKLKKQSEKAYVIRTKQDESFIRPPLSNTRANMSDIKNKCKKSNPFSSNVVLNLPTPLPVKKNPSPPATKIIQKQSSATLRVSDTKESSKHRSQLSSCSSQANKQEPMQTPLITREREKDVRHRLNGVASFTGSHHGDAESQYIRDILSRTVIQRGTTVCFNNWFSPSQPLDPSVFLYLEEVYPSTTSIHACNHPLDYRWNRKLLFDAVDEVLVELLKPCMNMNMNMNMNMKTQLQAGSKLIATLCTKLRSFPKSDCHFMEDIDELIEGDLSKLRENVMAFEQEGEGLVAEIEGYILDILVQETISGRA